MCDDGGGGAAGRRRRRKEVENLDGESLRSLCPCGIFNYVQVGNLF
jgi:hypothetical protein